jgi:hypothetical protein
MKISFPKLPNSKRMEEYSMEAIQVISMNLDIKIKQIYFQFCKERARN